MGTNSGEAKGIFPGKLLEKPSVGHSSLKNPWRVLKGGASTLPFGEGGRRGVWEVTMAGVSPREGGRWLPGAGGAAHPASRGTFTARSAQTMGREAPYRCGAGLPRAAGRRAAALPRLFLPATPWPPGEVWPAEKPGGGGGRCRDTCGRARETKRGCVRPQVRKPGAGGGRARALRPGAAHCSQSAGPHALDQK